MKFEDEKWEADWTCEAVDHSDDSKASHNFHLKMRIEEAVGGRGDRFIAARTGGA